MKNIEVVAGVIFNKENKIFCAKRKDYGELGLRWGFPGGKIERGESNKEALISELLEELSIDVEVKDYIITIFHKYKSFNLIMHAYYCNIKNGNIKLNDHVEYKWLQLNELDALEWAEADIPIIDELRKRGN